jgi:hypothetical protein
MRSSDAPLDIATWRASNSRDVDAPLACPLSRMNAMLRDSTRRSRARSARMPAPPRMTVPRHHITSRDRMPPVDRGYTSHPTGPHPHTPWDPTLTPRGQGLHAAHATLAVLGVAAVDRLAATRLGRCRWRRAIRSPRRRRFVPTAHTAPGLVLTAHIDGSNSTWPLHCNRAVHSSHRGVWCTLCAWCARCRLVPRLLRERQCRTLARTRRADQDPLGAPAEGARRRPCARRACVRRGARHLAPRGGGGRG